MGKNFESQITFSDEKKLKRANAQLNAGYNISYVGIYKLPFGDSEIERMGVEFNSTRGMKKKINKEDTTVTFLSYSFNLTEDTNTINTLLSKGFSVKHLQFAHREKNQGNNCFFIKVVLQRQI